MTLQIHTRTTGSKHGGKIIVRDLSQADVNRLITDYAEAFNNLGEKLIGFPDRLTFVVGD